MNTEPTSARAEVPVSTIRKIVEDRLQMWIEDGEEYRAGYRAMAKLELREILGAIDKAIGIS